MTHPHVFLPQSIDDIKLVFEIAVQLGTLGAGGWAIWLYTNQRKQARTQWLASLWRQYYVENSFDRARRYLIWEERDVMMAEAAADAEVNAGRSGDRVALMISIDNYLNFFEFMLMLVGRNELTEEEADSMFGSPFKTLKEAKNMGPYLHKYEYVKLEAYLKQL